MGPARKKEIEIFVGGIPIHFQTEDVVHQLNHNLPVSYPRVHERDVKLVFKHGWHFNRGFCYVKMIPDAVEYLMSQRIYLEDKRLDFRFIQSEEERKISKRTRRVVLIGTKQCNMSNQELEDRLGCYGQVSRLYQVKDYHSQANLNITVVDFEDPKDALNLIEKGSIIINKAYVQCKVQIERVEMKLAAEGRKVSFGPEFGPLRKYLQEEMGKHYSKHQNKKKKASNL